MSEPTLLKYLGWTGDSGVAAQKRSGVYCIIGRLKAKQPVEEVA